MALTVGGSALTNWSSGNGRYSRTLRTPTFSPPALSHSTASWVTSAPLPITTMTRSASGCPTYSTRPYARPTTSLNRAIAASTCGGHAV